MAEPAPVQAGLRGLCPRCGAGTLFAGLIRFAPRCSTCGLDIAAFNVGDGPAAFLTLGIGTLMTILAIAFELGVHPPFWLHFLIWPPVTVVSVMASLRVAKAWLLALEYRNHAAEGRLRR